MEQQNKMPDSPTVNPGKRFWYVWGPVVLRWAISIGTGLLAIMVCSYIYMSSHYDEMVRAMNDQDKMMELYMANVNTIMEMLSKTSTIVEGVAALITIPIMIIFFHKDRIRERMAGIISNRKAPLWKYAAVILMAITMSMGLNNLIIIGNLSQVSESYEATMQALYTPGLAVQIICLCILIPVCEELVYRGLLFRRLRQSGTYITAAVFSSVVFGVMHMNLIQMLYGFIQGMMLAYVYEKYGSIKAPVAAHITINLFSVLATHYKLLDWMSGDIMRIGIITVVCAALAATMFVFVQRIENTPSPLAK